MRHKAFAAALLASISMPAIAHAQDIQAEVEVDLNLRVGPSTDYRVITTIPDGDDIVVYRCASTYNWCDVGWNDWRGWVFADYIQYYYEGRYVPLVEYVEVVQVPVVQVFVFEEYATAYYADRPFYDELQPFFSVEIEFEIDDEDDIDDEDREREVVQDDQTPPRDQDQAQDDNQDQMQDGDQDQAQDGNQDQMQDDPNQDQAQGTQDQMQDGGQDQAQDGNQDQQRRLDGQASGQADAGADVQVEEGATGSIDADANVDAGGGADVDAGGATVDGETEEDLLRGQQQTNQ